MEGYKTMFNESLVTVWSAPNYCYRCGNQAAILELNDNLEKEYKIFDAASQVINLIFIVLKIIFSLVFIYLNYFQFKQDNRGIPAK